jgi:short-subunit dehydrogenase
VLAKQGSIDVLINCAGIYAEGDLTAMDPERIKAVLDVNALGTIYMTRAVLRGMQQRGEGRIINIISQSGLYGRADHAVYAASKWAVTGFTKSLIEMLKGTKITVTGFYPGPMKTKIFEKAGLAVDTSGFLDTADVVRALRSAIDAPANVAIPELGINPAPYTEG